MQRRLKVLRELVLDSSYMIDPDLVANAIIERARTRQLVPDARFRNDVLDDETVALTEATGATRPQVRSFRPARGARSFKLTAPRRSRDADHRTALAARA